MKIIVDGGVVLDASRTVGVEVIDEDARICVDRGMTVSTGRLNIEIELLKQSPP